jgi:hypothetical protein
MRLLIALLAVLPLHAASLATFASASRVWRLRLNIGRESGTAMPADWASSGARLAFAVDVQFLAGACDAAVRPVSEKLLGTPVRALTPLKLETSFVGAHGEERVRVLPGGWSETKLSDVRRDLNEGQVALRFFLDVPDGATRNDVSCPAGRIFFTTDYYDEAAVATYEAAAGAVQAQSNDLEEEIQREKVRMNEGNALERTQAVRRMVRLMDKRTLVKGKLDSARSALPDPQRGAVRVEGTGLQVCKTGGLTVKRRGGPLGLSEEYHIIGTFTMQDVTDQVEA